MVPRVWISVGLYLDAEIFFGAVTGLAHPQLQEGIKNIKGGLDEHNVLRHNQKLRQGGRIGSISYTRPLFQDWERYFLFLLHIV